MLCLRGGDENERGEQSGMKTDIHDDDVTTHEGCMFTKIRPKLAHLIVGTAAVQ